MDCNTPDFPVLHYFLEFAQIHVPRSQWCHLTISFSVVPFPPTLNLSQPQGLFQWVSSLHQVAKVLKLPHQSFQWIFRVDFLQDWLAGYPRCPRFWMLAATFLIRTCRKGQQHFNSVYLEEWRHPDGQISIYHLQVGNGFLLRWAWKLGNKRFAWNPSQVFWVTDSNFPGKSFRGS